MSTFLSKNSGTSNTVTNQNGKMSTNVINWNAESTNDITKIIYELTTNGKSKYAEVSLPTTHLNTITNGQGLSQLDGPLHSRLIKDYSIDLSDLHPNVNMKMLTNGGFKLKRKKHSSVKVAFPQFNNETHRKKNKQYRKTPIYRPETTTWNYNLLSTPSLKNTKKNQKNKKNTRKNKRIVSKNRGKTSKK
jgi:hypothetical protein